MTPTYRTRQSGRVATRQRGSQSPWLAARQSWMQIDWPPRCRVAVSPRSAC